MNSTFYNGIAGVKTHQFGIDSWSNNIANINTNGYKAQLPEFSTIFATAMEGLNANSPISNDKGYGAMKAANGIDMTVGSLELADESPLNMALSGQGWFVVGNKTGNQISYTRDGAFSQDSQGNIVTNSGQFLYGVDLGRIDGSVFSSDAMPSDAITSALNGVTSVGSLTPLKIPENLTYPAKATTEVYAALNLNPTSSLRSITSAFAGYVPDTSTDMADFAGLQSGDTITINGTVLTYGTNFTTIGDFLSDMQTQTGLSASYSNDTGAITFKNATGADVAVMFASSNATALTTLGLPASQTIASSATLALTPTIPLSTTPIFDQRAFRSNDLDTIYKEDGTALNLKAGDTISITLGGTKTTIVYGTDFTTVNDLMANIQSITGLIPSIDETNNSLKFTNNTTSNIGLKFESSNASLIQTLGLPASTTISSSASIFSSSLKVPSYMASTEVYDASGAKLLLNSTFTLTSANPQIWQMHSGVYNKQGEQLLSSEVVSGALHFDSSGKLTSSSGVPATLTLSDGTSISYDPTQDKTAVDLTTAGQSISLLHQTTGASYMSSTIKQDDQDGNALGYLEGLDIDSNGIVSLSFSNDKFETFGRVGIAGFINNQGLFHSDNTLFGETANSGTPRLLWNWGETTNTTGELQGTSILSGKLEKSNVDLATALTELMVYQRSYTANTKSITIADELVRDAINMIK